MSYFLCICAVRNFHKWLWKENGLICTVYFPQFSGGNSNEVFDSFFLEDPR